MSKNKCMEQRLPKCVACEVDPMFHGRCKVCEELDPELIADRAAEAEQLRMDREDGIR